MKITIVLLIVAAICAACGYRLLSNRPAQATIMLTAQPKGRVGIVYYSQSQVQNTATLARWIQKYTGGDLIPLEMVKPYPEPYSATLKAVEQGFKSGRLPELKNIPKLEGYDIVFIGTPIWYGTYALPIGTFLKATTLSGKTIVPFSTHGGGGEGRFPADLRKACPQARMLEGLSLRGSNQIERRLNRGISLRHTEDDVVNWLNRIFASGAKAAEKAER
ncbi:MAG: flavodoxin [Deltaproteobacteria bacterium]|nr:flavodoxin [Deltaproteobacteria bacterium]